MVWLAEEVRIVSGRILKTDVKGKSEVKPFHLNIVGNERRGAPSARMSDNDSEIKNVKRDAYNKGIEDGLNKGRMLTLKELGAELKILKGLIEGVERLKDELYRKIEVDVIEMSLIIARKIIGDSAEENRNIVVNTAKEAIKRASDREVMRIRIAPVDYDVLNKKRSELIQCFDGIKSLIFEADESVQPGGCLIETNHGEIDARIDSQIRVMRGELLNR
ncbi:MAG: FliH/SctL family protein [Nitrospirota bacterium]